MTNQAKSKSLIFAGDLFVSQEDDSNLLKIIKNITDGDLFIANLEGAAEIEGDSRSSVKKAANLKLNNNFLSAIKGCDNSYYGIVNNHITDSGFAGYKYIKNALGCKAIYSSTKESDPRKFINGYSLMFFADEREECLCQVADFLRFDLSIIDEKAQFVKGSIIIVHGGIEYRRYPTYYQRKLSLKLIDLGAHSVLFHHSHVMGMHEWYKGKLIHYGLGNFYFSEQNGLHGLKDIDGCVLRLRDNGCSYDYEVARVRWSIQGSDQVTLSLDYENLEKESKLPPLNSYKKFYKNEYKINSSLRPRQLFESEILNRIHFKFWYAVASRISRAGLSSRLKKLLRHLNLD